MAKIYSVPKGFEPPKIDFKNFDYKKYDAEVKAYLNRLREWCKKRTTGTKNDDLLGTVLSYGVADGAAQYMVCDVSKRQMGVIHLELGDAYRAHGLIERGMNVAEARAQQRREKAYKELSGKKEEKVDG